MAQKPNKKGNARAQKADSVNSAVKFLLAGCLAEAYLLVLRKYFINGKLEQVVQWDGYLQIIVYAGLIIAAAGLALGLVFRKEKSWKQSAGWTLLGAGAFLAVASWLVRNYVYTAITPLCIIVPVVMLLGILWRLYDRECVYSLSVLGVTVLVLWLCRKGLGTVVWNTKVLIAAVLYLAVMAVAGVLFWKAGKANGMLGNVRMLPKGADAMPVYASCVLSLAAVAVGLVSTTAAYYAIWAVCLVIFALAVYYTVRQL